MDVDSNGQSLLGGGKRSRDSLTETERLKEAGEVVDKAWIRTMLSEVAE